MRHVKIYRTLDIPLILNFCAFTHVFREIFLGMIEKHYLSSKTYFVSLPTLLLNPSQIRLFG